jgi:hypothetical protein
LFFPGVVRPRIIWAIQPVAMAIRMMARISTFGSFRSQVRRSVTTRPVVDALR